MLRRTGIIRATPSEIWTVLAGVRDWPTWLPTVTAVRPPDPGSPEDEGARYALEQPGLPAATWTITQWLPTACLTWETSAPGVRTVATHVVVPFDDDSAEVHLGLNWTGPRALAAHLRYGRLARRNVEVELAALTATVEQRTHR